MSRKLVGARLSGCLAFGLLFLVLVAAPNPQFAFAQSVDELIKEETGYISDLEAELADTKKRIARLGADEEEEKAALELELAGMQKAVETSKKELERLQGLPRDTKVARAKPRDKVQAKDSTSGNSANAKLLDPCKVAEKYRRPKTTLYGFPSSEGFNPRIRIPRRAGEILKDLRILEAMLVNLLTDCRPVWESKTARQWHEDVNIVVNQILWTEEQFLFEWAGGYTKEEEALFDQGDKDTVKFKRLEAKEERLRRKFEQAWAKYQESLNWKDLPDSSMRLALFALRHAALKARDEYYAVSQQRAKLELGTKNSANLELRKKRIERALEDIGKRLPALRFRPRTRQDFIGDGESAQKTRLLLLGEQGVKIYDQQTPRRVAAGYRAFKKEK